MRAYAAILAIVLWLAASVSADPMVTIDHLPPWNPGSYSGYMSGTLTGVADPTQYVVAPVIYVQGGGWYSKPYASPAYVPVNADGSWSALVTTGGVDPIATDYIANVYHRTDTVPVVLGAATPPISSSASAYAERYGRVLDWCGYDWNVKTSCTGNFGALVGPGPNRFTDSPNYVWVDGQGILHIKMHQNNGDVPLAAYPNGDGNFYGGEVYTTRSDFGYGRYSITIRTPLSSLPGNVVMGSLFTWSDLGLGTAANPNKEIDLAESGAVLTSPNNLQYVQQPWNTPGNRHQFVAPTNEQLVAEMDWRPDSIDFTVKKTDGALVDTWRYTGPDIPLPGDVRVVINGWYTPLPASGQEATELTFSSFAYSPMPGMGDATGDGRVDELDYLVLKENFGGADATWEQGDFNNDKSVDVGDLLLLQSSYGNTYPGDLGAFAPTTTGTGGQTDVPFGSVDLPQSQSNVPEPSAGAVALVIALVAKMLAKKRRSNPT